MIHLNYYGSFTVSPVDGAGIMRENVYCAVAQIYCSAALSFPCVVCWRFVVIVRRIQVLCIIDKYHQVVSLVVFAGFRGFPSLGRHVCWLVNKEVYSAIC